MEAKLFDSIVKSGKGLAVDFDFDKIVESILGEFPFTWLANLFVDIPHEGKLYKVRGLQSDRDTF